MSFDLIVRGGILPDGSTADIGIHGETIAAIEPGIQAGAGRTVDASGCLVAPPFVDPHFHMDATLSYGIPRINASGTLLEGISLWGELKPLLTHEAVKDRALRYCDWAVSMGLLAIRTAGPTDATVIDPHEFPVYGVRSVSPSTTLTSSTLAPSASAAICANTVRDPVPRSCVPLITSTLPSGLSLTSA